MYFYTRLMLALDLVIPISSTSLPGGNLVDGLPPAASFDILMFLKIQSALNLIYLLNYII